MKKRIYSLDFLRIPAAMMIVMHHFQQAFSAFFPNHINYFGGRFSFGYVVEFFFVLSGFLMLPAVRKIYSGEVTFGEFAFRRARRLLPMLAVCALAYDAVEVISWAQSGFGKPLNISLLMTVADMLGIQSGWCFQTAEINTPQLVRVHTAAVLCAAVRARPPVRKKALAGRVCLREDGSARLWGVLVRL